MSAGSEVLKNSVLAALATKEGTALVTLAMSAGGIILFVGGIYLYYVYVKEEKAYIEDRSATEFLSHALKALAGDAGTVRNCIVPQ